MPRKPNPPPDDAEQAARFIETAKLVEVDDNAEAFERALKILKPEKEKKPATEK